MKQDKLEKFIIENREEFDVFEPGTELWDRIQKPAPKVIRLNWKTVLVRVAAVVIIFIASYYFHDLMQKDENNPVADNEQPVENEDQNNVNVLIEAEMFYTSQINTARDEIILLSGNDENLIEDLNHDLVELDKVFEELKNDLKDNSDNEEVIEAMIQNYRIKLEVLDEILLQLKKSKNTGNEKSNSNEI
jgi:CHASE3 domain sensor protein